MNGLHRPLYMTRAQYWLPFVAPLFEAIVIVLWANLNLLARLVFYIAYPLWAPLELVADLTHHIGDWLLRGPT